MGRTVRELELTLTSRELSEWAAYYMLEPFGQHRTDDGARGIMALMYNANRPAKSEAAEPSEFMPVWKPPVPKEDPQVAIERARAWFERQANG